MYETFFDLKEKPFNLTPDPRYLYISPSHREALAHLVYGIQERKGFIVVTGEVGTGKTTLLHTLLENLDTGVKTAFVFYPKLHFLEFLQYVLDDFGLRTAATTTAQCLLQLNQFLIDQHTKGKTTVLVIDEAQNLPLTLLEDIRMLGNLETTGEKLLQIVLVGQPELQRKLQSPHLRQLRQRIGVICEIHPLPYAETQAYIQHRCTVAGGDAQTVFSPRAFKAIHAYTNGIPRLINTVCDHALLTGYAEEQQRITPRIVRQVIHDLEPRSSRGILTTHSRKVAAVLASLLLLGTALYLVREAYSNPPSFLQMRASLQRLQQLLKVRVERLIPNSSAPNERLAEHQKRPENGELQREEINHIELHENSREALETKKTLFPVIRTVQKGDSLSQLAIGLYGFSNSALITRIKEHNPHIKDIDRIKVGDVLLFPALNTILE